MANCQQKYPGLYDELNTFIELEKLNIEEFNQFQYGWSFIDQQLQKFFKDVLTVCIDGKLNKLKKKVDYSNITIDNILDYDMGFVNRGMPHVIYKCYMSKYYPDIYNNCDFKYYQSFEKALVLICHAARNQWWDVYNKDVMDDTCMFCFYSGMAAKKHNKKIYKVLLQHDNLKKMLRMNMGANAISLFTKETSYSYHYGNSKLFKYLFKQGFFTDQDARAHNMKSIDFTLYCLAAYNYKSLFRWTLKAVEDKVSTVEYNRIVKECKDSLVSSEKLFIDNRDKYFLKKLDKIISE
jgi:hypothetical protein